MNTTPKSGMPWWFAPLFLTLTLALLASCVRAGDTSQVEVTTVDQARSELRSYIEGVTKATASSYGATDDRGNVMDTVKIIAVPDAGGFAGVYHTYRCNTQAFDVHLATSADLMNWTWRVQLASQASQPTIKPAADGGFVVAWEQEPHNHLKFAYYSDWADLLGGVASKTFDAPLRLSACAEGTPNLYSASSTFVDAGFHFYANCELDRQARGVTDWNSWNSSARPRLDQAVLAHGVTGGVGDRDVLAFSGFDFTLLEAQVVRDNWRSFRVLLYDDETGAANQLDIRTHAGSVAFANPTIEKIEIDGQKALLVTLFLPQEGSEGGQAGELIYYTVYD